MFGHAVNCPAQNMNSSASTRDRDESASASELSLDHTGVVFQSFFERSVDAVLLLDPQAGVFVDCNRAAVELAGAENKEQLLHVRPEELSPPFQPDGTPSVEKSAAIIGLIQSQKAHLFEWVMRRRDGRDVPIEVSATALHIGGKSIHVIISRDISERKKAERELLELNQSLEQRVTERTAALTTSEARFRALVEHAAEAIVVFDGDTGRFLFGNEHACRLYGVTMEKLTELTPADVSPEFQPGGRRSSELARELMAKALAGGMPVFEWIHLQRPKGRLIPTEVRLLRLPAEGQNLIRASIIDNTERKCAERALRESEAKFRALFEGASQGVVLHDENQILEVNPAAVRILGRRFAHEILGKHPGDFSPQLQPNGESSDAMARKHIGECMTQGSARFDWLARDPTGREISLEVMLTRIEWSGRQVIQAFITDITDRKRAQAALEESEARFSAAFQASSNFIATTRMSDGHFVLVNDAFVNWSGYSREEIVGRTALELGLWEQQSERQAFWDDLHRTGSVRQRECRFRNRAGRQFTMLISAEVIQLDHMPHMLGMALDITARKQAEAELRASEAQLRESEARFSVAFQASPVFIGILRITDGKFVLVNDALINWLGCSRSEALGQSCADLGMWENIADRAHSLTGISVTQVVVAIPSWLLGGIGDQLEDPLGRCCDLSTGHDDVRGTVDPRAMSGPPVGVPLLGKVGPAAITHRSVDELPNDVRVPGVTVRVDRDVDDGELQRDVAPVFRPVGHAADGVERQLVDRGVGVLPHLSVQLDKVVARLFGTRPHVGVEVGPLSVCVEKG